MSNKYLEKVAETFAIKAHSADMQAYGVKHINLSQQDVKKYKDAKGNNAALSVAGFAAGGAAGHKLGKEYAKATMPRFIKNLHDAGASRSHMVNVGKLKASGNKFVGAALGLAAAGHMINAHDHNKRLANAGLSIVHGKKEND